MAFRPILAGAAVAGGLLCFATLASASPSGPARHDTNCFLAAKWSGWKSPSPDVVYLRVNISDIYRLDLSAGSSELNDPDVHLKSVIRGSDWICSPLDLQLEVVDSHGAFREPLIVKSITRLTPDEVRAIPPKYRP